MNTRSQGGSVIETGAIELMQNRRLLVDDYLGVDEPLNEMNADGVGLQVIAKYFMQIFDYSKAGSSLQRSTQLTTDQPIQYFFTSIKEDTKLNQNINYVLPKPEEYLALEDGSAGGSASLKVHQFMLEEDKTILKDSILVRVENMDDLFDGTPSQTTYFKLAEYCRDLY